MCPDKETPDWMDDDTALGVSDALVLTNWELAPATGAGDC